MKLPFPLKKGAVVVFEGLDATGKSTQLDRMEAGVYRPTYGKPMFDGEPLFLHMPSGSNALGAMVYDYTEEAESIDPFARQLLHLAVHAEEVQNTLLPALSDGKAVFLDRFWWSTVAYGAGPLTGRFSRRSLHNLASQVWSGVEPDVVYLFMDPWTKDPHNTPKVRNGYKWLAEQYPDKVTLVPGPKDRTKDGQEYHKANTQLFILQDMVRRGIYKDGEH
jgi:dTMP kinase